MHIGKINAIAFALACIALVLTSGTACAQYCNTEMRSHIDSTTIVRTDAGDGMTASTTNLDRYIADKIIAKLQPYSDSRSTAELTVMAAEMLLGTPYVAGTLEKSNDVEELVINLHQTDCIIFVETCMNLALTVKKYGKSAVFENFAMMERLSRYRNGHIDGYASRLHYTSEWIMQGEARGIFNDISAQLGGEEEERKIFFMSRNADKYRQLAPSRDPSAGTSARSIARKSVNTIVEAEKKISAVPFYFIKPEKIKDIENKIKSGDIICYVSGTPGLDIAHVALAFVKNGKTGFVHASMADMKVEIDKKSISEYVLSRKSLQGIKVIRLK